MSVKMKTIAVALSIAITSVALGACTALSTKTYCLEEKEANGLDYMVVADVKACDNANSDTEYFDTTESYNIGDVVYVEADGEHSVKRPRRLENIKPVSSPPPFTSQAPRPLVPAPTKICLKAAYKPAPPAPPKPAPAPAPKPPAVAPKPQPAPVVKAPVPPVPTATPVKPGY
jgi:hypothetical protein